MASSYRIKKIKYILCIWLTIFVFICDSKKLYFTNQFKEVIEFSFLKDGDLVCRLGKGYFSNIFKEYASKDKVYSHIGIIVFENKVPYVIHSEASELTGIGGVKIEALNDFLEDINKFSFYRLKTDSVNKVKIISKSKYFLQEKVKFDLTFNSYDDSEMYCTEFIAKCINYGIGKEIIKPSINLKNEFYYGLDDIYNNQIVAKLSY